MYKIVLPQIAIGNYWISDTKGEKEKKLVNIESEDGNWQIVSNNFTKIVNLNYINSNNISMKSNEEKKYIDKIVLKEYRMYGIYLGDSDELFILYCSPVYENNFLHLDVKHTWEILIGNGTHNHISYNNSFISKTHARISFHNGRCMIENLDSKFGTFVNNNPVPKEGAILLNGDVIFIMGLKIIIMGRSIYINNPQNKVAYNSKAFIPNTTKSNVSVVKETEEQDDTIELYSEQDYFSRAPRITNKIEHEKIKIDAPPQIQNKEEMPLLLSVGSSMTMGLMMVVSIVNAIDGLLDGTATTKETVLSLIVAGAMLVGMMLFPILNVKYERKKKIKHEKKRQQRYKEYLNAKNNTINKIKNKQKSILLENYVSAEECAKIILDKGMRLWERKVEDYDFLKVRWGIGNVSTKIDIQYPEERFAMEDDNLVEILKDIVNDSKTIKVAPMVTSLAEKNIAAIIVQNNKDFEKFLQSIIIQLIAFQSYEDLKLVFLLKEDSIQNWEYVKMLPHVWNHAKSIRFFADNYDDMKEISKYLEEELQNRLQYKEKDYKSFMPYYLIITDDYKRIENLKIIREILKAKINVGFSILCITPDLMQLPNQCKVFVSFNHKMGMIFENEIASNNQNQVTFDTNSTFFFEKICQTISNIPIRYTTSGQMALPNTYTFLEMYDVGCIEQLNILERWKKHDSTLSLKAPIGVDGMGMQIVLDIHEKFHGPHGLIAGSTGSGKSEFIITYILSLAINYHPDDVTFILIDYKGGGLAGAFQKNKIKLPHLVGTITNIDTVGLQRSLDSIQSELRRRQVIFNEARNRTDEGTIDIYKYQRLYHEGIVSQPVPHLLIICDEFAELKQQQEEFMEELMSVSRIGRSLGVHLILATQKPAGIVNEQIRSNSKFAVCLKVQNREDSQDVINRPDAANLKYAGQFYLQVGNDEYFVLGQSAWAGAPYFPSDITKKKVDNSIEFISNIGTVIKKVDDSSQKVVNSEGEQLTSMVRYLYNLAEQEGIKAENLWLDNIPETIFVKEVRKKYRVKAQENNIEIVIGEYDDPFNQRQDVVKLNLFRGGNTVIYGNAESGKETLLSTMVYDLMTTYSTKEVQIYLLDFGSEALKIYKESPSVGDVVFINDVEKISRLFNMIQNEIKNRKEILSDYNGDYHLYISTSGKSMPMMVVMINNYETFSENFEDDYEDTFITLTREGIKCGIIFIVTTSTYRDIKYRLSQNFKQKIALQLNNEDDYFNILDKVGKKRPSHIFGRGLICLQGEVYEFQTAKICEPVKYNSHIKEVIENLKVTSQLVAKPIPVIPDRVNFTDVSDYLKDITTVPLGITKKDLKIFTYDFKKNFINMITSKNIEDAIYFTSYILEEIKKLKSVNIIIFDAERLLASQMKNLQKEFNHFLLEIEKKNHEFTLCIIYGLDKFLNDIEDSEYVFSSLLAKAEENGNYSFIIVENSNRFKNHEYDQWYKEYINGDNGIWVGNGIDNQYLININTDRRKIINNCGCSYGYVIKQGIPTLIKLLGMKENGDENE